MQTKSITAVAVLAAIGLVLLLGRTWYVGQISGGGFPEAQMTGWIEFETVSWVIAVSAAAAAVLVVLNAAAPWATLAALVAGGCAVWKFVDGPTAIVDFVITRQPAAYLAAVAGVVLITACAYLRSVARMSPHEPQTDGGEGSVPA
jgi:hypothetical protein